MTYEVLTLEGRIDLKCYHEFGGGRERPRDHESAVTWNSREEFQGGGRTCAGL